MEEQRACPETIIKAMKYSLFAGGKRLRPILMLSAHELVGGDLKESLPLACGLELIHTYSLIHDDLPAMDDDDYRRGVLTNHKVFGEGMAILAGDALLNLSYECMLENAMKYPQRLENHLRAIKCIATAAGVQGMIGGQAVDLEWENKETDPEVLEYIHEHKTGALIVASLMAGILLENCGFDVQKSIESYGRAIGLAFQITDDILDITGSLEKLGKKPGRDEAKRKATFPQRYGLEKSRQMAEQLVEKAIEELKGFDHKADFLKELARFILLRQS